MTWARLDMRVLTAWFRPNAGAAGLARYIRARLTEAALILGVLGVIWISIAAHLREDRAESAHRAEEFSADLARAADEDVSRAILSLDRTLFSVRAAYAQDPADFVLSDWLRRAHEQDGLMVQVAIVGRDGWVRQTSLGPLASPINLGNREHIRLTLSSPGDALLISPPVRGRISGRWIIQLSRKLFAADGSLAGAVIVSFDPSYLTRLFEQLEVGHGSLLLVGTDGIIRARSPHGAQTIGGRLAPDRLAAAFAGRDHGSFRAVSPIDGVDRIESFRWQRNYPLLLIVGLDTDGVFAAYRLHCAEYIAGGIAASALVLLLGGLLLRQQGRLWASRQALTDAVENISQGMLMVDNDLRVAVINRRAIELLGLPERFLAQAISFNEIFAWQKASGEIADPALTESGLARAVREAASGRIETVYERVRPNGSVLEISTRVLASGGAVRTFTDITERKRSEARIAHLAHHDGLTGLANRSLLHERLQEAIAGAARSGRPVAVLGLDLDRFKLVNDRFGHDAGDALLMQVADRLRAVVRATDLVGRMGGDEFVIMQTGGAQPEAAAQLARRIVAALAAPFDVGTQRIVTATSIGIAVQGAEGSTGDALLKNADVALYRAKAAGRGVYRFFEPEMDRELGERRMLESELRAAIGTGQMQLVFQPQLQADTLEVTGFEALLRWQHPRRGLLPPLDFIPMAEECGLIGALGRWVLDAACATAASWPAPHRIAVNVSPAQFHDGELPAIVAAALRGSGLAPERLELEITEGLVIGDAEQALRQVLALKALGVRIAVDDFGTGYSSLSYLRRFPFDRLKIDRSFVQGLETDAGARAIVQAILSMSRGLALAVTAEGVETDAQRSFLHAAQCDDLQGLLLGPPMPAESVAAFLAELRTVRKEDSVAA